MILRWTRSIAIVLGLVGLCPSPSAGQQTQSGIAGVVRDTSGGALPGVTVEAASPALIEKVRSVVTDGEGRFNIVDLRPGTYSVTFSLPGFSNYRREGIELPSGFTATVNGEMQVGALEETITVSGAAPLVDTTNTRQQSVVSTEMLDSLPTSTGAVYALAAIIPGLVAPADVGGSRGVSSYVGDRYHGKRDAQTKTTFDGMRFQNMQGIGNSFYIVNAGAVEEMVLETGGTMAESIAAGFGMNLIPKEGSNIFSYSASGMFTNKDLQSANLSDELRARGLTTPQEVTKLFELTATFGGPIVRDRLWFFTSQRLWGNRNQVPGVFWNKTQGSPVYTPDLDRPYIRSQTNNAHSVRLTWQASDKNKIAVFVDPQRQRLFGSAAEFTAPEAVTSNWNFWPVALFQVSWNSPRTSRLLLEAGASATINHWPGIRAPGVLPEHISILEQSTGFRFNNKASLGVGNSGSHARRHTGDRYAQRFAMSYITGTHAFKVGFQLEEGSRDMETIIDGDRSYTFQRGVPVSVTQYATPYLAKDRLKADLGIFAQDQWTIKRLTLNYGLRYNYFNANVPEQHLPAATWVGARDFDAVDELPEWWDFDPRMGASYDVFGNGKTAVKVALGRYVAPAGLDLTGNANPMVTSVNQVNRSWTDADGDFQPDCDLKNPAANGECGAFDNQNFGRLNPGSTRFADDATRGYSARGFNWDSSVEIQHEVSAGVSLTGGYYRNWYGNFRITDNLQVTPANFSTYCITAPSDPRLPKGGGYQVCGLADVNPDKFGQSTNLVTQAENFGKQQQVNDFFGLSVNTRFASGIRFGGGIDTGRSLDDVCFAIDSPGAVAGSLPGASATPVPHSGTTIDGKPTCRAVTPWGAQTQIKINGSIPLPRDFAVSSVLQNVPGPVILASYPASAAEVATSLGRNLSGGARTATVPLILPMTEFEDRRTQLDVRLTKTFRIGPRTRFQANFDVYNALNANSVLGMTTAYGGSWLRPSSILDGRLIEFGGSISY